MSIRYQDFSQPVVRIICLCTLILLATETYSITPSPGKVYAGGTLIEGGELGVQFSIPDQWNGALGAYGEVFLMEPRAGGATLVVIADSISATEAEQFLQGPVRMTDLELVLKGAIHRSNDTFSGRYDVSFNPNLSAEMKAVSSGNGTSIAIFLVTDKTQIKRFRPDLDSVFNSLEFQVASQNSTTTQSTNLSSGVNDQSWLNYLKGKHIVRFFTASGYTEEQHIWLCSNGQYVRRFDSGGFGGGASGAVQGNYDGAWTATGEGAHGQLILNAPDGQVVFNLRWDYANSRLYVDNKRWLHDNNNVCP